MSAANEKIHLRLTRMQETSRKPISIPFKEENIKRLDSLARAMTRHSGTTVSRNMLIEDAVESYIEEAVTIFSEEGIPLDVDEEPAFDTVVFPAKMDEDYMEAFFNDLEWRYVRVDKNKIPRIKYIALYVGAPQSSITHYATVAPGGFEYVPELGKYRIRLQGGPVELPRPVPLGSASPMSVRSPKYTTLQKLMSANEFRELYSA